MLMAVWVAASSGVVIRAVRPLTGPFSLTRVPMVWSTKNDACSPEAGAVVAGVLAVVVLWSAVLVAPAVAVVVWSVVVVPGSVVPLALSAFTAVVVGVQCSSLIWSTVAHQP